MHDRSVRRTAFTLIELLVTITIIAMLSVILLNAVQAARNAARRLSCLNNARQVTLATLNSADAHHGILPAAWRTSEAAPWDNFSWRSTILPFLEEQALFDHTDFSKRPTDNANREVVARKVPLFECPATPGSPRRVESLGADGERYSISAGAHDMVAIVLVVSPPRQFIGRGIWHGGPELQLPPGSVITTPAYHLPNSHEAELRSRPGKLRNAVDGFSKTALLVEQAGKPTPLGPVHDGEPHPPTEGAWATCDFGTFGGFGINTHNYLDPYGFHRGATTSFCDGSVVLLSQEMSREIMVSLFSRDGHEIVASSDWQ